MNVQQNNPHNNGQQPEEAATPTPENNEQQQKEDMRWKNPFKHGLTGIFRVLPSEDPEEYGEFQDAYLYELGAVGIIENDLATRIAQETWRLKRADAYEMDMVPQIYSGQELIHFLNLIALYRGRIQRLIDRTWMALRRAQEERRAGQRPAIDNCLIYPPDRFEQEIIGPGYMEGVPWDREEGEQYRVKMADIARACEGYSPPEDSRTGLGEPPKPLS